MIYTKGDANVIKNLKRKQRQANEMFNNLVQEMNNSLAVNNITKFNKRMELPTWL